MKKLCLLFTFFLAIALPATAQDAPILSATGLEEFQVGKVAPSKSAFPGLTTKRVTTVEWHEGEKYDYVFLKFFLNGHYLGKARLREGDAIDEITIVDPAVRYEGGFAVGSTWDEIQRVFPRNKLQYGYLSDTIWADSEAVPGFQIHFSPKDHVGNGPLVGEWMKLKESDLKASAKAKSIRLFSEFD